MTAAVGDPATAAATATPAPSRLPVGFLYAIFTVSGVAGLIYEAVWARYLKLFLGNDAYAQALVLAIFLGGLAIGAAVAGHWSARIRRPLLGYAIVEGVVAVIALLFHPIFVGATGASFATVVPLLGNPALVEAYKWLLGALLLLPQAILLGTTFPLLAAGVARARPGDSGRTLAWLYFTNSLGGACGVLLNGFVLVPWLGLPGAVLIAGLLNALVGLAVVLVAYAHQGGAAAARPLDAALPHHRALLAPWLCMLAAAVTGAASLVYEIAWVRLLALVLGSSNHAFELMLSAFILGLAIGGFFIRNRVDKLKNPLATLGLIQLAMGALASATLYFYREAFLLMGWLLEGVQRTDPGYLIFQVGSHAIALVVMLPATICAGMTLPVLTWYQLAGERGERAIGRTYAANTFGSIVAVFTAVHFLLPGLGVKGALLVGVALDVALGAWLLWRSPLARAGAAIRSATAPSSARVRWYDPRKLAGAAAAAAVLLAAFVVPQLDAQVLTAGLFQNARTKIPEARNILYHKDGKTSALTVTGTKNADGVEVLRGFITSGKGNGSLYLDQEGERVSGDEPSFGLVGLLPLAFKPSAERVACIGLGTGLTAHAVLASPAVTALDIIEIEQRTVETAAYFKDAVPRALGDPRSTVHIADAKTFFSSRPKNRYDIILSNPSNLWVSGVSGLFTEEFYELITRSLNDGGILMQWISLYTTDAEMVASVVEALSTHFPDYALYLATNNDLLIVAYKGARVPPLSPQVFEYPEAAKLLARYGVAHLDDLRWRFVGDRASTLSYFRFFATPANSDFFPLLDSRSLHAFFRLQSFQPFYSWRTIPQRAWRVAAGGALPERAPTVAPHFQGSQVGNAAYIARDFLLTGALPERLRANPPAFVQQLRELDGPVCPQNPARHFAQSVQQLLTLVLPYTTDAEMRRIWQRLSTKRCAGEMREAVPNAYAFFEALATQNHERLVELWEENAPEEVNWYAAQQLHMPLVATFLALHELERFDEALELFHWVGAQKSGSPPAFWNSIFYLVARTLDAQEAKKGS